TSLLPSAPVLRAGLAPLRRPSPAGSGCPPGEPGRPSRWSHGGAAPAGARPVIGRDDDRARPAARPARTAGALPDPGAGDLGRTAAPVRVLARPGGYGDRRRPGRPAQLGAEATAGVGALAVPVVPGAAGRADADLPVLRIHPRAEARLGRPSARPRGRVCPLCRKGPLGKLAGPGDEPAPSRASGAAGAGGWRMGPAVRPTIARRA